MVVVASGDANATLTDVSTSKVVARIPVGGRSRAAVAAPDGSRGYVAAGARVVAIDLTTRQVTAAAQLGGAARRARRLGRRRAGSTPSRRGAVEVIDTATFTVVRAIAHGGGHDRPDRGLPRGHARRGRAELEERRPRSTS